MDTTLTPVLPHVAEFGSEPCLNVLIAYEDLEAGKHAKKTYDFLVAHAGLDCQVYSQMWKFELLSVPGLRELAVADAAAADIIMVSCHGTALPPQVKSWMESWLGAKERPVALVALFDRPAQEPGAAQSVRANLADVARRGGMEFFAQPDEWPGRRPEERELEQHLVQLDPQALSALADSVLQNEQSPLWDARE